MTRSARTLSTLLLVALALAACSRVGNRAAALRAGDPVPHFRVHLRIPGGDPITLGSSYLDPHWLGERPDLERGWRPWTILAFFPQAFAPDSISFLKSLRDAAPELDRFGAQVFAISTQRSSVLRGFADALKLPFPLLSDRGGSVAASFGVLRPDTGLPRCATFILRSGSIAHIAHGFDVGSHGGRLVQLVKRLQLRNGGTWNFRAACGGAHIDWGRHPGESGMFLRIYGHRNREEYRDVLVEGELPIHFGGRLVPGFTFLRELLRERSDPAGHPDKFLSDDVTPRPPIDGDPWDVRYSSFRTLYIHCEWDAAFGLVQAVIHRASRLPDEDRSSVLASSPLISRFHLYRHNGGVGFSLPENRGIPDPTGSVVGGGHLSLEVSPSEWDKPPAERRVSLTVAGQDQPIGHCNGVTGGDLGFWMHLSLDPPDTIDQVIAALRERGLRKGGHLAIACSPRVPYGLVFGVLESLPEILLTFPLPPGVLRDVEAGRIR